MLQHGRVDGALLVPALMDALCSEPDGLAALRSLRNIHYVGAPLGVETGLKLSSHVAIAPSIGSTEAGGYFTKIANPAAAENDWDYVEFQHAAGVVLEPRASSRRSARARLCEDAWCDAADLHAVPREGQA